MKLKEGSAIVLSLLLFLISTHSFIDAQIEEPITIRVDELGFAFIYVNGTLIGSEAIECVGEPLYVYSFDPPDLVVYLDLDARGILLISPSDEPVRYSLTYVSLISRPIEENVWSAQLDMPVSGKMVMPEGYVIKKIEPLPREISKVGNSFVILLDRGNYTIVYLTGVAPGSTTTNMTTTQNYTSINTTVAPPTPSMTEENLPSGIYILLGLAVVAIAAAAYLGLMRRKKPGGESDIEVYLDDRDRAIVNYLREKGSATPTELMEATGIPKSAFYRRINRLEKLGIIESIDLGVKKIYKLKGKG